MKDRNNKNVVCIIKIEEKKNIFWTHGDKVPNLGKDFFFFVNFFFFKIFACDR